MNNVTPMPTRRVGLLSVLCLLNSTWTVAQEANHACDSSAPPVTYTTRICDLRHWEQITFGQQSLQYVYPEKRPETHATIVELARDTAEEFSVELVGEHAAHLSPAERERLAEDLAIRLRGDSGPSDIERLSALVAPGCLEYFIFDRPGNDAGLIRNTKIPCLEALPFESSSLLSGVAGNTIPETFLSINEMKRRWLLYRGFVLRKADHEGKTILAVTITNETYPTRTGYKQLNFRDVSFLIRELRTVLDETKLGELRYEPIDSRARERANEWLDTPAIREQLDFEIHFSTHRPQREFTRGDTNEDGQRRMSDAIYLLDWLYGPQPTVRPECADAFDANDDGGISISDAIHLLYHLYIDSRVIPPPSFEPGPDPTPDVLPPCGQAI